MKMSPFKCPPIFGMCARDQLRRLPSLLLWMSNRGRKYDPWNGRNLCLGVEPIASAFDLGTPASVAPNPIAAAGVATALTLDPATPVTVGFRLSGRAL